MKVDMDTVAAISAAGIKFIVGVKIPGGTQTFSLSIENIASFMNDRSIRCRLYGCGKASVFRLAFCRGGATLWGSYKERESAHESGEWWYSMIN